MNVKYILKLFLMFVILFGFILLIPGLNAMINNNNNKNKNTATLTLEAMNSMGTDEEILSSANAFCEHHRGKSGVLNTECGKLTEQNCNATSCCGWTSPGKCVAGGPKGPIYNTDENGKTKELDSYSFQNKCSGPKCK